MTYQYILAPAVGWFVAQGAKFVLSLRKDGLQVNDLFVSGGMPSSHSAMTVALATAVGFGQGFGSAIFSVAATFAAIVMYDAQGVRKSTGDQFVVLQKLAKKDGINMGDIHQAKGHTLPQIVVGAMLGVVVGYATNLLK
jgi:uncharacterized protein